MSKAILLIAETVVVINIVYVLLPNGSFEKYSKHILGLMLILVFAGTIVKVDISSEILDFDGKVPVYNAESIKNVVDNQTKKVIESKIAERLSEEKINIDEVKIEYEDNEIKKVEVLPDANADFDRIIDVISDYCGISANVVIIK